MQNTSRLSLSGWYFTVAACLPLILLLLLQGCHIPARGMGQARTSLNVLDRSTPAPASGTGVSDSLLTSMESASSLQEKVDIVIAGMTLQEKVGQLFVVSANGYFGSEDDASYQKLVSQVQEHHIGGLIFFRGNVYGQAVLTNKLQKISRLPLWITQDMEYGAAMRVSGTTRFVPAMGVAATGNPDYAYKIGKITAREARALGVNQIFAPVLDVNNNPDNPVINVRSFSGDPLAVAKFGQHFIDGVQSEGVLSTAKHFPGHGDTDIDSHISLPVIDHSYMRLDSVELVPFRSVIKNGIPSIMSAHIAFPNISATPDMPATLDPSILNRILVDSLKFDGMVVTDGLEMNGVATSFSPGEAVVRALDAGVDLMLLSPDETTAINEVLDAVRKGKITEKRIEHSARKLIEWKIKAGLFQQRLVDIQELGEKIHTREHKLLADEISRKSLTLLKNKGGLLPLRAASHPKVMVLSIADDRSGSTGSYFARLLREFHPDVTFHVLDRRSGIEEKKAILEDANRADLIILGSFIFVRSGQSVQISSEQMELLNDLPDKPSVLVAFGNPYVVNDLPDTDAALLAWSSSSEQIRSAVPALFGGSRISGRLPIPLGKNYSMGHGLELAHSAVRGDEPETAGLSLDSLKKVDRIMNRAIFDSTFPGGVVAVVRNGVIAYRKAYGYKTYTKVEPIKEDFIYDLASLTKVVGTTAAVMKLVEEGALSLDDRVSKYIAEYAQGDKAEITIRNLLLHNSGLPPFRVYVDSLKSEDALLDAIRKEPLTARPGEKYVYSDLGFILLGEIVEAVSGKPLDRYLRSTFYYPLGMSDTHFNPGKLGYWVSRRIPPTEIDTVFRNKRIQAEVHDERAWYLNGVAGHAGLFSSSRDLAIFAQMLMNGGTYAGKQYLSPQTIQTFTARQSESSDRGYGFDHKSEGFSSAGTIASPSTFGHTGFTGTSMWIDPERNTAVIMLTNRTWPNRSYGKRISRIRAEIADAVLSSIID